MLCLAEKVDATLRLKCDKVQLQKALQINLDACKTRPFKNPLVPATQLKRGNIVAHSGT